MSDKVQLLEKQLNAIHSDFQADPHQKIDMMNELAWELRHFNPQQALDLSNTAYDLAQGQDYPHGQLDSLCNLAALNTHIFSKYDVALSWANQALSLLETCPNKLTHARLLECMGTIYMTIGDYPTAHIYLVQALALCRQTGAQQTESMLLNDLGILYTNSNDYQSGLESYQQALEIAQTLGDQEMQARMMNNIGDLLNQWERYEKAFPYLEQSLALTRQLGIRKLEPIVLDSLSEVYTAQGNYEQALDCLQQACQIAEEFDNKYDQSTFLRSIARVYQSQREIDLALDYLHRALTAAEAVKAKLLMFTCHRLLAEIYEARHEPAEALFHYKQFYTIRTEVFNEQSDQKLRTLRVIHQTETARQEAEIYRLKNIELQAALDLVNQLSGLLPICANCKKIRDDNGYWQDIAIYIRDHSEADFTHGICPDCLVRLYPEYYKKQ